MLGDGLQQRRYGLRRHRPADRACRAGANGEIEIAQLVDRGFQLVGGNCLWSRRFLNGCLRARGRRSAKHTENAKQQAESINAS
jgi:hypothetical protein